MLKSSAYLIILGELLYYCLNIFGKNPSTDFANFTSGLLLGLSIGMKVVGIILLLICITKNKSK